MKTKEKRGPSRDPQNSDQFNWYYEGRRHFTFVHEVRDKDGGYIRTDQFNVPLSMLRKSINRILGSDDSREEKK